MVLRPEDVPPDIFLCHSKVDVQWVTDLAAKIEREDWQGRKLRVALDDWDVVPGDNVILRLTELLAKSRFVAVVLTPELVDSDFCALEWTSAVYDDPSGRKGKVLPIIHRVANSTDLSARGACFPAKVPPQPRPSP